MRDSRTVHALGLGLSLIIAGAWFIHRISERSAAERRPKDDSKQVPRATTQMYVPQAHGDPAAPIERRPFSDDPSPSDTRLSIRTVDTESRPVATASIFDETNLTSRLLGATDDDGRLSLPVEYMPTSRRILAKAPRLALGEAVWRAGDAELLIVMNEGAEITGRLQFSGGLQPAGDIAVVASPCRSPALREPAAAGLPPRHLSTTADAHGYFRIDGALSTEAYKIRAIGSGAIGVIPDVVRGGTSDLVIEMQWLYHCYVDVDDAAGGPPRASEVLRRDSAVRLFSPVVGARLLDGREPAVAMYSTLRKAQSDAARGSVASLDAEMPPRKRWRYSAWFSSQDRLGKIESVFRLALPGYDEARATVAATPVGGEILINHVRLTSNTSGFGTISVTADSKIPYSEDSDAGTIHLARESNKERYTVPIRSGSPFVIEGVPCDQYKWRYVSPGALYSSTGVVDVGPAPATIPLDFSRLGALRIRISDGPNSNAIDQIQIRLRMDGKSQVVPFAAYGGQVLLHAIPSGTLHAEASVLDTAMRAPVALGSRAVVIEPGAVAELVFSQ